jgi:hypothetical protein
MRQKPVGEPALFAALDAGLEPGEVLFDGEISYGAIPD